MHDISMLTSSHRHQTAVALDTVASWWSAAHPEWFPAVAGQVLHDQLGVACAQQCVAWKAFDCWWGAASVVAVPESLASLGSGRTLADRGRYKGALAALIIMHSQSSVLAHRCTVANQRSMVF